MTVERFNPQQILHYRTIATVDEQEVRSFSEPLVVVHYDGDNEHIQAKVEPFSTNHSAKLQLTFAEKIQYYKKKVRRSALYKNDHRDVVSVDTAGDGDYILEKVVPTDYSDGIGQELADFNTGFTTKPVTAFADINSFFQGFFYDISPADLADMTAEINS